MTIKASAIYTALEKGKSTTWLRGNDEYETEYEAEVFDIDKAVDAVLLELQRYGIDIEIDQRMVNSTSGTIEIA